MNNDNILVIGGSGFIGEYFVSELIRCGKKVSIFNGHSSETIDMAISKVSVVAFLAQPNQSLLQETFMLMLKEKIHTFLYSSTVLLYKEGEGLRKESDELFPVTEYAKNKYEEEKLVIDFKNNNPQINLCQITKS